MRAPANYGNISQKVLSSNIIIVLLIGTVIVLIPTITPSAEASVHGVSGALSTQEEDGGANDAEPATPFLVRWAAGSDHYIEGNYTVDSGYTLKIDPGCIILFNGSYSIFVLGALNAQGTSLSRITFSSNSSSPAPGNWSSIDFVGGEGSIEYCNIQYAEDGIRLGTSLPVTINDNEITENIIGVSGSHPSPTFINNNISANSMSGIKLDAPSSGLKMVLTNNMIINNMGGEGGIEVISMKGDITATITGNEIGDNFNNGIFIYALIGNVTASISNNNIFGNSFEGIYLIAENNSATLNTTISDNNLWGNNYGIWLDNYLIESNTTVRYRISGNNISNNGDGIYVTDSGPVYGEILDNDIINNGGDAIYNLVLDGECQFRIMNNTIKFNGWGIELDYSNSQPASRMLKAQIDDNIVTDTFWSGINVISGEQMDLSMEGNTVERNYYGLWVTAPENLKANIHNNTFNNNQDRGITIDGDSNLTLGITQNEAKNNLFDNLYIQATTSGNFRVANNDFSSSTNTNGIYVDEFKGNGVFEDNIVSNNPNNGFEIFDAKEILIINCTIENNYRAVYSFSGNVNITNSTISSTQQDFYLYGGANIALLNTSYDNTSAVFGDSKSNLTVKWFLNVRVIDTALIGVDNADILVNDSFGANEMMVNTGSGNSGWVHFIPSTEYRENSTAKNFTTPHNVSARKGPESGYANPKIWQNTDVIITINSGPFVDDIRPEGGIPQIVFRGDSILIFANSSDATDPEDQLIPYFEYRDPNDLVWNTSYFSQPATYVGSAPAGYWMITFSPELDGLIGWYDLRVRFEDTAGGMGDYFYANDTVLVANNLPEVLELGYDGSIPLKRGGSITIYAEGDDREHNEDNLIPVFEYRLNGTSTWSASYFDSAIFSSPRQRWESTFSPLMDAPVGSYDFRVQFSDPDGNFSNVWYDYNLLDVFNNIPTALDISFSANSVLRSDTININANGFDPEDPEEELTPEFEIRKPNDTQWTSDYLFNPIYINNEWRIDFTPSLDSLTGVYDLRVLFNDTDMGFSEWIYKNGTITVNNNLPQALDIDTSATDVVRGSGIYIYANGTDLEDAEEDLLCDFSYRLSGGSWDNVSFSQKQFTGEEWRITFIPSPDLDLGSYDLRVGFYDKDGDFSEWIPLGHSIEILNSLPIAESIGVESPEIFRTESVIIYATGHDLEDASDDLTPLFRYKQSLESIWDDLDDWSYNTMESRYEVSFTPSSTSKLDEYDFQVRFTDPDDGESEWKNIYEGLLVKNNIPSVIDISISKTEIFRGEDAIIYANAEDNDLDESDLVPTFQYTTTQGAWETLYLGTPQYIGGQWQVMFSPPLDADFGNYMFQVQFSDSDSDSNWMLTASSLAVKNNLPSVEIETSGSQRTDKVSFSATVSDSEDSLPTLTFEWDFGDDEISNERTPTHDYRKSGSYTVTLKVTDKDGGETIDTSEIRIEGGAGVGSTGGIGGSFPLWILIVLIIVIVVVLIVLLMMKKKKPEKELDSWQPEPQPAQTEVAQPPPTLQTAQASEPPPPVIRPATPQAPAVPTHTAPLQSFSKNIKCPRCYQTFTVELKKGPNSITCPHCQTKGKINL